MVNRFCYYSKVSGSQGSVRLSALVRLWCAFSDIGECAMPNNSMCVPSVLSNHAQTSKTFSQNKRDSR